MLVPPAHEVQQIIILRHIKHASSYTEETSAVLQGVESSIHAPEAKFKYATVFNIWILFGDSWALLALQNFSAICMRFLFCVCKCECVFASYLGCYALVIHEYYFAQEYHPFGHCTQFKCKIVQKSACATCVTEVDDDDAHISKSFRKLKSF